jgi:transcription elongation factor GreA
MSQKTPMTKKGAEALRNELEHSKRVLRPQIIEAIAEARAHGDLKENGEYHAAREQQSFLEGRIADLESKLANCLIIDPSELNTNKVVFGATLLLINLDTDEHVKYQIVGVDEADLNVGKISISSPIARALIGKESGDEVNVETPIGVIAYEIAEIHYE